MADSHQSPLQNLRAHLHTTQVLGSIHSALYYDQNTAMPAAGANWRGEQLALLAQQLHGRQSSGAYADLLAAAEAEGADRPGPMARNLQLLRQEFERQNRLDGALVGRIAQAQAQGYARWQEAKAKGNFSLFAPSLQELVGLRQEQARQLAEPRSCWETLAQPFEPDCSKARLDALFAPLRNELPALIELARSAASRQPAASWDLPESSQQQLCQELLNGWGFDPSRCQTAGSPHPFSCTLGPADFRITTRVVAGQPLSALLATAHEWGHSLYEQGLPRSGDHYFPWPLGDATSMGVHESQSLFWECRVGRSQAFAQRLEPSIAAALSLANPGLPSPWINGKGFWRCLNSLEPGLIRVEADEISYCLHIVLRYELELALLEGDLPVAELPDQWNRRMAELLDLRPAHDSEGCLQDVHWSEGLFGYFPSYALGHLISAQLAEAMEGDLGGAGSIEARVAIRDEASLKQWLAEHVYPLGRQVNGEELVKQVSGHDLSPQPFLAYLRAKLERLMAP
jgi:carboxypeptidase Taq